MAKGHDGDAMPPMGMGEPIMEMPLGIVGMDSLAPTLMMMQNLPAVASFAATLSNFILENDLTDQLVQWMYNSMCSAHKADLPADRIEELLKDHKELLEAYLNSLGQDDGCSHDAG